MLVLPHPLRLALLLAIGLSVAAISTGCTAWATYPPIPGAAQIGRPEFEPVPTIMAEAILFAHDRHGEAIGIQDEIVFNLPEGTSPNTYDRVIYRLRKTELPARWMTEADDTAIHIESVRIRANAAQVDIIYPRQDGHHELVMLSMRQKFFNQYEVEGSRLWRIQVAVPGAHYYPPGGRDEWFQQAYPERYEVAEDVLETDEEISPEARAGALPDAEFAD